MAVIDSSFERNSLVTEVDQDKQIIQKTAKRLVERILAVKWRFWKDLELDNTSFTFMKLKFEEKIGEGNYLIENRFLKIENYLFPIQVRNTVMEPILLKSYGWNKKTHHFEHENYIMTQSISMKTFFNKNALSKPTLWSPFNC